MSKKKKKKSNRERERKEELERVSWKRAPTDNVNEDLGETVNVFLFYSNDLKIFFLKVKKENQNLSKES